MLIAIGSHGDVHPFVGIGIALRARGHQVSLATNGLFAPLVRGVGLDFIELGTESDFRRGLQNPDIWHPIRGFNAVMEIGLKPTLRPTYEIIASRYVRGETVVAASSLAIGARVAQDALGVPVATIHLSPAIIRSVHDTPKLPGMIAGPWVPKSLKRLQYAAVDRFVIDRTCAPLVNAQRAELGLPPVDGIMRDYWNSPQRVIGLFPDWFAPPQPDWPSQLRLTGFPMYDERGATEISDDLRAFLDAGDAPIAFTPGSANVHGRSFFEAGAAACVALKRRGMLLTRHREQVPANLPPSVRHFDYAPFSQVLPRCAALVHHGGVGTTAQALAAGCPQVVMALSHDQFDNAMRVERLGVGKLVSVKRFASQIAPALARLISSDGVRAACAAVAKKFEGVDAIARTCDLIEDLRGADSRPCGRAAQREVAAVSGSA